MVHEQRLLVILLIFVTLLLPVFQRAVAEPCDPNDPRLLKPDLQALTPTRARVVERQGARRLYFTTKIANVGKGPLIVEGKTVNTPFGPVTKATQIVRRSDGTTCTKDAGSFEFHKSHNHFHVNDFAEYLLRKDDPYTGPIVARASKISFCLTDIEPVRGFFDGTRQVFANCGVQEGIQGISPGWADVYDDFYPEQYIELDICRTDGGVPPGQYYLVNVADPDDLLLEEREDYASNAGIVAVTVPPRTGNFPIPTDPACPQPPPSTPTATGIRPTPTATPPPVINPRPPRAPRPPRPTRPPRPARRPGPHG